MRYLKFEKARFGEDRIVVTTNVDEDAEDMQIPAFVIQPLVENAVRHAMPDEGPLGISITVAMAGDRAVSIEVADDGVGMDEQTAMRLFDQSVTPPDPNAPQGGGAGVAMHNISGASSTSAGPSLARALSPSPDMEPPFACISILRVVCTTRGGMGTSRTDGACAGSHL